MSSSPSPSSSAVTIPTPGRSILKKPPPPPQSFFSLGRLSKLLPNQPVASTESNDETKTLKRAHFILPELTTVYPIYSSNPPSTPLLKDEKRSIEERELERRKRVVRRNSVTPESTSPDEVWWSLQQVESFYRECCVGREETPDPAISAAFLVRVQSSTGSVHAYSASSTPDPLIHAPSTSRAYNSQLDPRLCYRTCSQ